MLPKLPCAAPREPFWIRLKSDLWDLDGEPYESRSAQQADSRSHRCQTGCRDVPSKGEIGGQRWTANVLGYDSRLARRHGRQGRRPSRSGRQSGQRFADEVVKTLKPGFAIGPANRYNFRMADKKPKKSSKSKPGAKAAAPA